MLEVLLVAEEKLMNLKSDVIKDVFVMDGKQIAVINGDYLGVDTDIAFGKLVIDGDGFILEPLSDEQYDKASAKYEMLLELFFGR